jgi:hypothetical protein
MTDDRDPVLQSLFAANQVDQIDLDGKAFTARVMAKTHSLKYWLASISGGITLVFLICIWIFNIPLQEVVQFITQTLATTLFDLGDSWTSWVFAPVNNIASLFVLSVKAMRVIYKKARVVSYSS